MKIRLALLSVLAASLILNSAVVSVYANKNVAGNGIIGLVATLTFNAMVVHGKTTGSFSLFSLPSITISGVITRAHITFHGFELDGKETSNSLSGTLYPITIAGPCGSGVIMSYDETGGASTAFRGTVTCTK